MQGKNFTAIIVDDEPDARSILNDLLKDYPEIQVVAKSGNPEEALSSIVAYQPDIVFLDIEMPGQDGLQLAQLMRDKGIETCIIFITAFNEHAIEAFSLSAFDYLLKPIDKDKLKNTIERLKKSDSKYSLAEKIKLLTDCLAPPKIRFNTRTGFILVDPKSIVYCQADGNYSHVYLNTGKKEYVTHQLGKVEEMLNHGMFIRVNRSTIVNKDYISSFNRKKKILTLINVLEEIEIKVTENVKRDLFMKYKY